MKRDFLHWRSLKTRLTVLTLAVFLAGIWLLAFYASRTLREDMQNLLGKQQLSTATIVAEEVNQELDERMRALELTAGLIDSALLGDVPRLQRFLEGREMLKRMFNFGFTVVGIDGMVVAAFPIATGRIGVSYADRDFLSAALKEGRTTIGRPVIGRTQSAPVLVIAAAIRNEQGKVIGALSGVINLNEPSFFDRFAANNYGATGGYFLVAPRYRLIVTASDKKRVMETLPAAGASPELDRFIAGDEGTSVLVNALGEEVLSSVKAIPAAGWYLAVSLPTAEAFAPLRAMQRRVLWSALLLSALAVMVIWWTLKRQLAPLFDSVKLLGSLSNSNQAPQLLPIVRPDEVGELISGFNRLLETLAQRERALQESESRLRATLEAIPDLLLELGLDGRYQAYHSSGHNLRLATWETVRGKRVSEILPADAAAVMMAALQEAHACGMSHGRQFTLNLPQGKRWLELSVVRKATAADAEPSFVVLSRDVTENKRAEAALAHFAAIVENSQDAIVSRGLDSHDVITWNSAAERLFGYTAAEVAGKDINFFIPDDKLEEVKRTRALLAAGHAVPAYDTVRLARDGRRIDVSISQSPTLDANGATVGVSLIIRDISERKRAEQALRSSEDMHRSILATAMDGFWLVDAQGRLLEVNDSYCRMTGYSRPELLGMRIVDLDPEHSPEEIAARVRQIMRLGEYRFETRQRRKDGSTFAVEVSAKFLPDDGGGIVSFVRDISSRAALETQLREAQKMEAIGTLAGGIAHDFNNIVATILGNAELARQDASANPGVLESLEEIRKAGARGRELVRQILAFSRREPTDRKPIMLAPIVEESVRLLRATLPARIALEHHCEADLPAVLADANQMQQVLINLATNAMQAMRGDPGSIAIRLDVVTIDAELAAAFPQLSGLHKEQLGRAVRLVVTDDGPGMDPGTLQRIFEPFFTTKDVDEGTGLGLSVVHGIVQAHGGAVVAQSAPGAGATFTIYLPAAEPQDSQSGPAGLGGARLKAASVPVATPQLSLTGGQHILYLDDDEALVFLVRRLLERQGFRVSGYTDQLQALAAVRADPQGFDLVISDYNMPGMSGLDVAREVRGIRADLAVAIASGFIDETLRAEAGGAGVRELIFKADAVEEFCGVVQRLAQAIGDASGPAGEAQTK